MGIPEGADFEAVLSDNVVLYDVSHLLAEMSAELRDRMKEEVRRGERDSDSIRHAYGGRDPEEIESIVIHKSGADGPDGYDGVVATTRFVVYHRGWYGCAYPFWMSKVLDRDEEGRLVVYRTQPDDVRSWHTGGRMNRVATAIGVQGAYDGEWDLTDRGIPRVEREPSEDQIKALPLLVDYLAKRHGVELGRRHEDDDWGLTGHWEHGKPVCPGDYLRRWVMEYRGQSLGEDPEPAIMPERPSDEINPYEFGVESVQRALRILGYDAGPIDGVWGVRTRGALEDFQGKAGVPVDGWYGPRTARALDVALQRRGVASPGVFRDHPV